MSRKILLIYLFLFFLLSIVFSETKIRFENPKFGKINPVFRTTISNSIYTYIEKDNFFQKNIKNTNALFRGSLYIEIDQNSIKASLFDYFFNKKTINLSYSISETNFNEKIDLLFNSLKKEIQPIGVIKKQGKLFYGEFLDKGFTKGSSIIIYKKKSSEIIFKTKIDKIKKQIAYISGINNSNVNEGDFFIPLKEAKAKNTSSKKIKIKGSLSMLITGGGITAGSLLFLGSSLLLLNSIQPTLQSIYDEAVDLDSLHRLHNILLSVYSTGLFLRFLSIPVFSIGASILVWGAIKKLIEFKKSRIKISMLHIKEEQRIKFSINF